jgi:hypothetical protein
MSVVPRLGLLALLSLGGQAAHADESFRCGKWIVTSGMTLGEIISKCGEPASRQSHTEDIHVRNRNTGRMMKAGQTTVETLTWDRGARAAAMVVTIVDGTIKSIERKP